LSAGLPGVGNVTVFGAGNISMRIWLDPNKLQARGLMPQDVIQAIPASNTPGRRAAAAARPGVSIHTQRHGRSATRASSSRQNRQQRRT